MNNKKTLWVIGDSTLSSFEDKYYYPRYGYGTKLSEYLDESIEVRNIALSGRSSKSYTQEPEYKILLDGMKDGDFLIIGFGHNDEKTEADRFTSGAGTYKTEGSFANSLYVNYIEKARNVGCTPILCTPIVRRTPTGQWKDMELHVVGNTGNFVGGDYSQVIRELGKELDIPVVDMTDMTKKLYDAMTPENTLKLHAWPSNNKASVDNTHTNIWGARVNAYLCLSGVKELGVTGLAEHIVNLDKEIFDDYSEKAEASSAKMCKIPAQNVYLVENPNYVPTVFNADLKDSEMWQQIGIWKGTVFGDVFEPISKTNFVLEEAENGGIHIAAKNNLGKIAAVSDGIAMYYTKIPVEKNFILTAKVTINDYFLNDQVSFGLMARDDMYIDSITADILGDYVAAAPLLLTHGESAVNCFARKSGVLTYGGYCKKGCKPGDTIELKIESTDDGYACTFGEEQTITGGFDFKLTSIDLENVYVGMFAARNADVTFTDIELVIKN